MIAGLFTPGIEFVAYGEELFSLQDGIKRSFSDFTPEQVNIISRELDHDPIAQITLIGISDSEKLKQYAICRWGACNSTSDFDEDGDLSEVEYYDCGHRGKCPYEGKRCKEITAPCGVLSFRQVEIMKLVTEGLLNKEIADKAGLSENTVATHLQNIIIKIGGRNRVDIATFIKERGIA